MDFSVYKALSDLSKLEPLYRINYRRWSQKLLIFFKQLDVDYVLFSDVTEENKTSKTIVTSANRSI